MLQRLLDEGGDSINKSHHSMTTIIKILGERILVTANETKALLFCASASIIDEVDKEVGCCR